jgi:hypothetical protein
MVQLPATRVGSKIELAPMLHQAFATLNYNGTPSFRR